MKGTGWKDKAGGGPMIEIFYVPSSSFGHKKIQVFHGFSTGELPPVSRTSMCQIYPVIKSLNSKPEANPRLTWFSLRQSLSLSGMLLHNKAYTCIWVFSEMSFPRIGRLVHSDGGPLLIQFMSNACVSSR